MAIIQMDTLSCNLLKQTPNQHQFTKMQKQFQVVVLATKHLKTVQIQLKQLHLKLIHFYQKFKNMHFTLARNYVKLISDHACI